MKILIADDQAMSRKLLRLTLAAEGHDVSEASDGQEALDLLAQTSFDLVISDILMPGMDGYRFCYEVRRRSELQKVPVRGFRVQSHRVHRSGLHATKVDVVIEHEPGPSHGHAHRGLSEILQILDKSGLEPAVRDRASSLFQRLAEAEASVHGSSVEQVHFHEVGAVDAIVDVVGGCFTPIVFTGTNNRERMVFASYYKRH